MASRDLIHNVKAAESLRPAARTATVNGQGVDLAGFDSAMFVVAAGAWTDGSHAITAQESDDNSSYSAVAAADLIGSQPTISAAGGGNQVYQWGYRGTKRFVRLVSTVSGTTTGAVYGGVVIAGHPRKLPQNS